MTAWPFHRPRRTRADEELDAAHWAADRSMIDAKQQRARADRIGDSIRETGRRNHFGAAVAAVFRGDHR
ncbi:hypothetical protein [Blastococcus sp. CT_GayMR16]|uniref:DUF7620 family protein n=1 Tax=Blastococcus sp. CT_GayMR16 TaxID=2559607 RepID=UPI001072F090|nr:hypothetical protein [Blastococcus sp. CT_GayMR16]TFV91419.1 hypothetical protein E4P38_02185 [Blastococcus sp. CT_GayMR16]